MNCKIYVAALIFSAGAIPQLRAQIVPGQRMLQGSAGTSLNQTASNPASNFSIDYQRRMDSSRSFRIGLSFVTTRDNQAGVISAVASDSLSIRTATRHLNYLTLSGGLERERHLVKDVYVAAGLEARLGYGTGGTDTAIAYYAGTVTEGMGVRSFRSSHDFPVNGFLLQLRPYFGVRVYPGRRLYLGIDFGPSMESAFLYSPDNSGTSLLDMNIRLLTGQFRVGYRF